MNEALRRFLIRKKDGSGATVGFNQWFIIIITLVVFAIGFSATYDIRRGIKVENISRKYMLHIESNGYLTNTDKQQLIDELAEVGVEDVDFTGTTFEKVDFGEIVTLQYIGKTKVNSFSFENIFSPTKREKSVEVPQEKVSIAKN